MLSNLETETAKLMHIVLVGQPDMRDRLASPDLDQLSQRVTVRYHLDPLDGADTHEYINHRLRHAAAAAPMTFGPELTSAIHDRSGGLPRLINVICDAVLMAGYGEDRPVITTPLLVDVIRELEESGQLGSARRVAARGRGRVFSGTGRSPRHRPRSGVRRVGAAADRTPGFKRGRSGGPRVAGWPRAFRLGRRPDSNRRHENVEQPPPHAARRDGRAREDDSAPGDRPLVVAGPPAAVEPRQPGDGAGPLEFSGRWGCAAGARGLRRRSSCAFRLLRNPTAAVRDRPELARLRVAPRPVTVPARDRRRAPPSRPCRGGMRRRARIPRPLVHARATTADRLVVGSGARPSRARPSLERSPLPGLRARRPQDHLGAQPASTLAGSRPSLLAHG